MRSDRDLGCAEGTNRSCDMVRDCEFAVHLESDFEHLSPEESGEDRLWLRRAVEFLTDRGGDFMYLRRIMDEQEMMAHWWSQWMGRIEKDRSTEKYLCCPTFWWSNNPALFRNATIYERRTLPLAADKDGSKGSSQWSKPELETTAPGNAWIHRWGLFVHEKPEHGNVFGLAGCGAADFGAGPRCKYGFLKDGVSPFCQVCRSDMGFEDMPDHEKRFREAMV